MSKARFSEYVFVKEKAKIAYLAYRQERQGLCCRRLKCQGSNCSRIKSKRDYFLRHAVHGDVIIRYVFTWFTIIGLFALGILSAGCFSVGALSIGKYFALGDNARAMIALGDTEATGNVFQKIGELSTQDITAVKQLLDTIVPTYLSWAKEIIKLFL